MKIEISNKTKFWFVVILIISLIMAVLLQVLLFMPIELHFITYLSYAVNFVICIASFFALAKLSKKDSTNLGYVFLAFSMLKFGVYFLGFRFYFQIDDVVSKSEYSVFFIPYLISILIEVSFLIKTLNGAEMDPSNFKVIEPEETEDDLIKEEE